MRIVDARVITTCPSRNFVTLKILTDDGVYGIGDATLNGRELAVAAYLSAQVRAGADALMLFDTWGGVLAPRLYRDYSLAPMQRIVARLNAEFPSLPVVMFSRGAAHSFGAMAARPAGMANSPLGLGVDWQSDLASARASVNWSKSCGTAS